MKNARMKNLFDEGTVSELTTRIQRLDERTQAYWGKMNVAQALTHCAGVLEMAVGLRRPPRVFIGRILGPALKRRALGTAAPLRRNTPTIPEFVVLDRRDLATARDQLLALIELFSSGGPALCTKHPHPFFGHLTPQEWAAFEYKHIDHHLRQFGG